MWRSGGLEHLSTTLVSKESFIALYNKFVFSFYSLKYSKFYFLERVHSVVSTGTLQQERFRVNHQAMLFSLI